MTVSSDKMCHESHVAWSCIMYHLYHMMQCIMLDTVYHVLNVSFDTMLLQVLNCLIRLMMFYKLLNEDVFLCWCWIRLHSCEEAVFLLWMKLCSCFELGAFLSWMRRLCSFYLLNKTSLPLCQIWTNPTKLSHVLEAPVIVIVLQWINC